MTSIKVAHEDARVKLCAILDPWLYCYHEEIDRGDLKLTVPLIIVSTDGFHPYCRESFPSWATVKNLFMHSKNSTQENIVIRNTDHKHQCDLTSLMPFESIISTFTWPQTTTNETYLLMS